MPIAPDLVPTSFLISNVPMAIVLIVARSVTSGTIVVITLMSVVAMRKANVMMKLMALEGVVNIAVTICLVVDTFASVIEDMW